MINQRRSGHGLFGGTEDTPEEPRESQVSWSSSGNYNTGFRWEKHYSRSLTGVQTWHDPNTSQAPYQFADARTGSDILTYSGHAYWWTALSVACFHDRHRLLLVISNTFCKLHSTEINNTYYSSWGVCRRGQIASGTEVVRCAFAWKIMQLAITLSDWA